MSIILPENPYNPGHAENCSLGEINQTAIPPLSGKEGLYPRYARLVYLINGGTSDTGSDTHNKGWYATPEQLPTAGENGNYAIVGSTGTVWFWDDDTNKWVDSGNKGTVTKVNNKTGEVVLKAVDIDFDPTEGIIGDTVQAAITNVNLHTTENNTAIDSLKNRVDNLSTTFLLDTGGLYCNGGMAKTASAGFTTLSKATILVRFARKNTTRTAEEYICNIGDGGTVNTGISVRLLPDNRISVLFYFNKIDGTNFGTNIPAFDVSAYLDGKIHSLAVCWAGTPRIRLPKAT